MVQEYQSGVKKTMETNIKHDQLTSNIDMALCNS